MTLMVTKFTDFEEVNEMKFNDLFVLKALFLCMLGVGLDCARNPDTGARLTAPSKLTAAAGDQQITLTWQATPSYAEADYNIYQSTAAAGPFRIVATTKSTHFTITNLKNGSIYYFKVTASLNNAAESAFSNIIKAVPGA
jgi:hypothetical protein